MKPNKKCWLSLVLLGAVGAACFLYWPKQVHLDVQGVKYHLGEANAGHEEFVQVKIDGEVWIDWKGIPTFSGTIDTGDDRLELTEDQRKVKVKLNGIAGNNLISYGGFDANTGPFTFVYGRLYADKSFQNVTLNIFEETEGGGSGWGSDSGLMVSAPASSRTEALEVANTLMKKDMKGGVLK